MKKLCSFLLAVVMVFGVLPLGTYASTTATDYVTLFGELINGQENGDTKLKNLLRSEYQSCDASLLKDCYMVDMNNDSVPEILCILYDEEHYALYAVLVEYNNGFKVGEEVPFKYNIGSGGSECTYVLKAGGKFYFEEYYSGRGDAGSYMESWSDNKITVNHNGTFSEVYRAKTEEKFYWDTGKEDYTCYINGQPVNEINYTYRQDNFETIADGYNYCGYGGYEPQYGKDYDKHWDTPAVITVTLNGETIDFDQNPIIVDGRTLVPLRAIFEALRATVDWNGTTQTVTSTKEGVTISMTIGQTEMYKNGEVKKLDVAPQIIGGRTLVPVRAIAESFDINVDWNGDTNTVILDEY